MVQWCDPSAGGGEGDGGLQLVGCEQSIKDLVGGYSVFVI